MLVLQLLLPFPLFADAVGKFTDVRGTVSLTRATKDLKPIGEDPVFLKDIIATKESSRAKLLLVNDSLFSLASNSSVEITEFMFKDGKGKSVMSVTSGKVHTKILRALTPEARLEVRTPNAVAGARGTEWLTVIEPEKENSPSKSTFYTLGQSISVTNPEFPDQTVTVNSGQFTEVKKGFPPTAPAAFGLAAILGILAELGAAPGAGGAGASGAAAGLAAAGGVAVGTVVGITAAVAAGIAGTVAATSGGGDSGGGTTPAHHGTPCPAR